MKKKKSDCCKELFNGCCCCNCGNHFEDFYHCTTLPKPKGVTGCVCSTHKGWICKISFDDSKDIRFHSGWSEHGMCEMYVKKSEKSIFFPQLPTIPAFLQMITERAIYKKLGCSEGYPGQIRSQIKKGIYPKDETMRKLLLKAGWVIASEEMWTMTNVNENPTKCQPENRKSKSKKS